jgi:hypothetical protein
MPNIPFRITFLGNTNKPNKAMEPTPVDVTMTASALIAPSPFLAHLGR